MTPICLASEIYFLKSLSNCHKKFKHVFNKKNIFFKKIINKWSLELRESSACR